MIKSRQVLGNSLVFKLPVPFNELRNSILHIHINKANADSTIVHETIV